MLTNQGKIGVVLLIVLGLAITATRPLDFLIRVIICAVILAAINHLLQTLK